ncbi:lytic murein transglycosylase [Poseidonocella sedimentorum]|uniref:Lytic murein transglycosylase n=1 Tax=Poseidonocella sedimentorum TaxID=871652 RepID=A0A1I6E0U6_9RHOB|nr:lytic murein transglycosylase [Poseidonocella sedimentorum]SFR11353.1 lytic murein transglycosylase [Poseidonocella sedimentorum]
MKTLSKIALSGLLFVASNAAVAQCGGSFSSFLQGVAAEAQRKGLSAQVVNGFLDGARQDAAVLKADRAQGVFQLPFLDFSQRLISQNRLQNGRANAQKWDAVFDRVEREYGVSRGVLLAFWAFETDFGQVQGSFNTRNALLTLAHDCRRPDLFRPQVFAAMELYRRGGLDPASTTGAWAGEIGMVQMLPGDILENGVDGDGDGRVSLKTSPADALLSGAKMLRHLGWRAGEPWLQEVALPADFDWSQTGLGNTRRVSDWAKAGVRARQGALGPANLRASVLLPQGRGGPAFLAYPNFSVLFEWNKSFVYVTTAAYFATRLEGAPVYTVAGPAPGLGPQGMVALQKKLTARGHDVGAIDGILGAKTRAAVQAEQNRLGLPADAWPTQDLLNRL